MKTVDTDIAIIGAGTAGMTAYKAAKRAGKSVLLIESDHYGTTCARVGCMPSKLLIAAADAAHSAKNAPAFGVHAENISIDGKAVMQRVRSERDRFVGFVLDDVAAFDDADKLIGRARFLSDTQLQVDEHTLINARSTVIATGSSPVIADGFSHLGDRVIVNDDVFSWDTLPRRVLVVGSGVIGLELGQALSRLGVQTTLINRSASIGGLHDPEVRASATKAFTTELDLRLHTSIRHASRKGDELHVELHTDSAQLASDKSGDSTDGSSPSGESENSHVVVDYILMAIGRQPNIHDLGLENTSVKMDDRGRPVIDSETLQLASAPIFIAGDVTGTLPILHEAADEGTAAGANAAAYPDLNTIKRRAPIAIVFSDPQLAYVGQRYSDLSGTGVIIGDVDFANQGRSRIILKNYGKLRIYADEHTGLFLGAEMAGPHMEHIAHLLSWAFQQRLSIRDMLAMPFYHPVIEEGLRTALRNTARQLR